MPKKPYGSYIIINDYILEYISEDLFAILYSLSWQTQSQNGSNSWVLGIRPSAVDKVMVN